MPELLPEQPEVHLNPDQRAVALRHIQESGSALSLIAEHVHGEKPLSQELAFNALAVTEYKLRDLCQVLGVETNGTREVDARSADLRAANQRIHELEAQLGEGQSPDALQLGLKTLADQLNDWWDSEGFGHISDLHFGPYGAEVQFSCHLFGDFQLTGSDTPISDRERKALWYASLAERGFVLCVEKGESQPSIDDCDASRQALRALFSRWMPSAKVVSFDNCGRGEGFVVRNVKVFIRKLSDIAKLPVPPKS